MKRAFNPFLPGHEYIPDGEPYVFGNRVYIYGSHDRFDGAKYCMNDYVCWSAPVCDLADWRYEGVIYEKSADPLNKNGERCLYAPDVAQGADGRYYLYYTLDMLGVMSVAVCDTPAGQYRFYGYVKHQDDHIIGTKRGDLNQFDPGVLVDDDGRVHLYSGIALSKHIIPVLPQKLFFLVDLNRKRDGCYHMELEQDMITVKRGPKKLLSRAGERKDSFFGHEFLEASSIRKIHGKYYLIYSSYHGHELCYAVSNKPDGGFEYGGTIVSNGDIFLCGRTEANAVNYIANNHGSIIEINGQWYVFYHRHTNLCQFSRQACAEPINILPDGSIPQVEMTSCGLNGGPLLGEGEYEARIACQLYSGKGAKRYPYKKGAKTTIHPYFTQDQPDAAECRQYIANMRDGATAGFKYFEMDKLNQISVSVRGTASGKLEVRTQPKGASIAEIPITARPGCQSFSAMVKQMNGVCALYFTYRGQGYMDFDTFTLASYKDKLD